MSPRVRLALAALAVLGSLLFGSRAMTAEVRVALLEPTPNLLQAVSVALSPWGLRVLAVTTHAPSGDVATATQQASDISAAQGAAVVAWIEAPPGQRAALWLYDAQTGQTTVRPLSQGPPFDEASAAALALTLKTLLRSTTVAPPRERAGPALAASGFTTAPAPAPSDAAPASVSSAPTPAPAAPAPGPPATGPVAPATHAYRLEALVLARLPTGTTAAAAPRAALGATFWPTAWEERFGFGVDLQAGTSLELESATFAGTFNDAAAAVSARGRLGIDRWSVELSAGPSLHLTTLSGTVVGPGRQASVTRFDPALDVAVVPEVALGSRVRLGVAFGTSVWGRTQRYTLDGETVLRLPPLVFDMGVRASLALD